MLFIFFHIFFSIKKNTYLFIFFAWLQYHNSSHSTAWKQSADLEEHCASWCYFRRSKLILEGCSAQSSEHRSQVSSTARHEVKLYSCLLAGWYKWPRPTGSIKEVQQNYMASELRATESAVSWEEDNRNSPTSLLRQTRLATVKDGEMLWLLQSALTK